MTKMPPALRRGLFLIVCPARVGSSMLVNALQSHPAIVCHMEIFNPARVEGFWGSYRARLAEEPDLEERLRHLRAQDPASFLYKIAFDPQGRGHAGFKFKLDELLLPAFSGARTILTQDLDVRVILLTRWNLLRRYLSHQRARATGVTMRTETEQQSPQPPARLDPKACREDFDATLRQQNFVRAMFRKHPLIQVTYEELAGAGRDAVFERITRFLGAGPRPLHTVHAKLARENLSDEIANLDQLRANFRDTPFAAFLDD